MPDMLVKTYELPGWQDLKDELEQDGIIIKQALMPEMGRLDAFAREHFSEGWASEVMGCFTNKPVSCYYAVRGEEIIGFSCCDSTARGFFGPTGVLPAYRGKGIGKALLLAALHHLKDLGYAYAIIGGAGPTGFYEQACGAVEIPGSVPGIYKDLHV
ncbi:MAG TPA: GNAT family N-acetyltransferase [Clostridiales bacterium]|nr:GNAT family N-acetyltransferase [Clostridiales bacterium]